LHLTGGNFITKQFHKVFNLGIEKKTPLGLPVLTMILEARTKFAFQKLKETKTWM